MRNDCLDMMFEARRANIRNATKSLSELAIQCLPLHQLLGVIGPTGHLLANPTARTTLAYRQSAGRSMGLQSGALERTVLSNSYGARSRYSAEERGAWRTLLAFGDVPAFSSLEFLVRNSLWSVDSSTAGSKMSVLVKAVVSE